MCEGNLGGRRLGVERCSKRGLDMEKYRRKRFYWFHHALFLKIKSMSPKFSSKNGTPDSFANPNAMSRA